MTDVVPQAPRARRLGLVLAVGCGLVLSAGAARDSIGFEASSDWVRAWVASFGIWGPVAYMALLSVRHFLLLPSSVMLTLGGAAFGIAGGTLTGAIGLFLSGLISFYLFRVVRPDSLVRKMEARYAGTGGIELVERGTPLALLLVTAVPPAPQTVLYWAVSLTRIAGGKFAALIFPSGAVRALILSVLGAGLVEANTPMILSSAAAILIGLGLCSLSPTVRAVLLPPKAGPPRV